MFEDYGIFIPKEIMKDKTLSAIEKLLFGEIIVLCKKYGYCFATNEYLANRLGVSEITIKRSLPILAKENYIIIEVDRTQKKGWQRRIWCKCEIKDGIPDYLKYNYKYEKGMVSN